MSHDDSININSNDDDGHEENESTNNKTHRQTNEESVPATEAPRTSCSKLEVGIKDHIDPKNFKGPQHHVDNRSRHFVSFQIRLDAMQTNCHHQ